MLLSQAGQGKIYIGIVSMEVPTPETKGVGSLCGKDKQKMLI